MVLPTKAPDSQQSIQLPQTGRTVQISQNQKEIRKRRRASQFVPAEDSISSAKEPFSWSRLVRETVSKIKSGFMSAVTCLQKFFVGSIRFIVNFFAAPFRDSEEDLAVVEQRQYAEGRKTPQDLLSALLVLLKILKESKKPEDQKFLEELYTEIGDQWHVFTDQKKQKQKETQRQKAKQLSWSPWFGHQLTSAALAVASGIGKVLPQKSSKQIAENLLDRLEKIVEEGR